MFLFILNNSVVFEDNECTVTFSYRKLYTISNVLLIKETNKQTNAHYRISSSRFSVVETNKVGVH